MSKKRVQSKESKRALATPIRRPRTKRRFLRPAGWLLAALLVAGGTSWLLWDRADVPGLPKISTSQLDAGATRLIEEHLEAVRKAPRSGAAWGRLGAILRSFEFRDEAGRCLEAAERFDPREPRWPYLHGLLLANHSPAEAIPRLRRAVDLCGNDPEAPRLRLAKFLAEAGQWDEARLHLLELTRSRPNYAPAWLALAQEALIRGRTDEAIGLIKACKNDPRTARAAWSLLAQLQQRLGETNEAQTASQRAAALPADAPVADPFEMEVSAARGDPRELSDRSQRLLQSGRLAEAAPLIASMVRDHPQFAEGWLLQGRWQLLSNDPKAAEPFIRRHLELDPESVNGFFQLGMVLLAQKEFDDAAGVFQRAIQLKPDSGPAFYNLGFALSRLGRTRDAVAPFREAIRHNPERIDSYILLADLHVRLGEKAEAESLLRQAEAINPNDRRLPVLREKILRL